MPRVENGLYWQTPDGQCSVYLGSFCGAHVGINAVVTSPPYNQLGTRMPKSASGIWKGSVRFINNVNSAGYADDMDESEYQAWQNRVFDDIGKYCTDDASLFYNHQCRWRDGKLLHPVQWFNPSGWIMRQEVVWDRCGGMMFNAKMFCRFDERVLWFHRGKHKWNQNAVGWGTVWRLNKDQVNKDHPVAYPVALPLRCVSASTDPGDLVLDPFMGSGTTGVACIQLRRRFVGFDNNEKYCKLACNRLAAEWRSMNGGTAPKADGGFTGGEG